MTFCRSRRRVSSVACAEGVNTGNIAVYEGAISLAGLEVDAVLAIANNQLRLRREAGFSTELAGCGCDTIVSPPEATILLAAKNMVHVLVGFAARAGGVWGKV